MEININHHITIEVKITREDLEKLDESPPPDDSPPPPPPPPPPNEDDDRTEKGGSKKRQPKPELELPPKPDWNIPRHPKAKNRASLREAATALTVDGIPNATVALRMAKLFLFREHKLFTHDWTKFEAMVKAGILENPPYWVLESWLRYQDQHRLHKATTYSRPPYDRVRQHEEADLLKDITDPNEIRRRKEQLKEENLGADQAAIALVAFDYYHITDPPADPILKIKGRTASPIETRLYELIQPLNHVAHQVIKRFRGMPPASPRSLYAAQRLYMKVVHLVEHHTSTKVFPANPFLNRSAFKNHYWA